MNDFNCMYQDSRLTCFYMSYCEITVFRLNQNTMYQRIVLSTVAALKKQPRIIIAWIFHLAQFQINFR